MLAYLLKMTLCWTVLYGVYHFGWKRSHAFLANRLYLLGALLVGLVLPFLTWETGTATVIPWDTVAVLASTAAGQPAPATWVWQDGLRLLYLAGMAVALLVLTRQLFQLRHWYQRGTKTHYHDHTLVELPEAVPPFSFGRCLFVGVGLRQDAPAWALIERHELAHIQQRHTWDVLALTLLRAVFWFHPILWLYQQALRDQHEYAADAAVLQHSSIAQYGRLLLDQSLQHTPNTLTHLFFHSPLKKRILMMTNNQRGQHPLLKYALSLLTVGLLSWQVTAQSTEITEKPDTQPYAAISSCPSDEHVADCSNKAFLNFIYSNTKYPETAKKEGKEGMVVISFVVQSNGKIKEPKLIKKVDPAIDAEAMRVIRLAQQELQWIPATKDGKKVNAILNIPLRFKLK